MKYLLLLLMVTAIIWQGCKSDQQNELYGEWKYIYYHGDSMIFQIDTAQLIIRKFAVSKVNPEKDSVIPFERVYFYERRGDTFFLDLALPSDTGVQRIPSSYYIMRHLTADSLIMAPELGLDIEFERRSYQWPAMSKSEMIEKYRDWYWKNSPEYKEQQRKLELQRQKEEQIRQQQQ